MHLERALARIKRSHSHIQGAPDIERVISGGFVSELLGSHISQGGRDPRVTTSQELVEQGVPLRRTLRNKGKSRPPGGFVSFMGRGESQRKASEETLQAAGGRKRRFEVLSQIWRSKSSSEKGAIAAEAKSKWLRGQIYRASAPRPLPGGGLDFWGGASHHSPFTETAFVETIMQEFGTLPGSRMYSNFFRGKLREQAFIDDKEDIPPGAREVVSKWLAPFPYVVASPCFSRSSIR